jgi:tetrahydromethanopterin S-methyltransferase subunit F
LRILGIAWGVVTAVLICVVIYRSTLETREEDQIFLDSAGDMMASEQRDVVARIEKLRLPVITLAIISGLLFAVVVGVWLWQTYRSF